MTRTLGSRVRANVGCIALLCLLPALAYVPAYVQDEVSFAAGGVLALPPWQSGAPEGAVASDPLSTWQLATVWPAYRFINAQRHDPGALLWNPDIGLGQPFLANIRNRCFSLFSVPFYLFSLEFAWLVSLWLKLVVAGGTAFYVARRYGFSASFALVVALVYQWSGPVFFWSAEPMGDILPFFPLLLLSTDRLLLGQFKAWPKLAIVVALMVLGGDVRLVAVLLGIMLLYMLLRRARDRHHVRLLAALPGFALGLLFGLGLAAPQLLPYITLLQEGNTASGQYPWPATFDTLLGFYGAAWRPDAETANPLVHLFNVGLVPVLMLGVWLAIRRHVEKPIRHRVECLGIIALVVAAIPFLTGGFADQLPVLRQLHPAHYVAALALPLALMVAGAAEAWLHLTVGECKRVLRRMLLSLPLYWGGLLAVWYFAASRGGEVGVPVTALATLAGTMVVLVALFGATLLYPRPRAMAAGLALILLLFVMLVRIPHVPRTEHSLIFPETPLVNVLRAGGTRVGGAEGLRSWPLGGNDIPALFAPSTVTLNRTSTFLAQVRRDPLLQRRAGVGSLLLRRDDIQGPYAAVRADLNILEVFESGAVLFRDRSTAPPYRIAHAIQRAESFDPESLTPASLPYVEGLTMAPREGEFDDSIRLADVPTHTRIPLEVESMQPGVLVVAMAWYPGWTAQVDGKSSPVHVVDGVFQGVEVAAGVHQVTLRYVPTDLYRGTIVFVVSALIVSVGIFFALRRPTRKKRRTT